MSVITTRIEDELPPEFDALLAAAEADGVNNMRLLADEWREGRERFADPGALFGAWLGGELAGVGGLTAQQGLAESAMRMRRLYVLPAARRSGVGRNLASAMIQQGFESAGLLTCNAAASAAAPVFWEAMGFTRAPDGYDFTHWSRR